MSVTLRFQSTGTVPGNGRPVAMVGNSMTIGRGPENDIVLPDPDRLISKRHCVIENHGGNVVVIDFSTNGTFLNYGKVPLGQVTTPLNDGDVLSMGTYELVVSIATPSRRDPLLDIPPPLEDGPVSHGQAGAAPDLTNLLDDPGTQGGDFLDGLLGAPRPAGPSSVQRDDPLDPLDLAPLPDDDDFLQPAAPVVYGGASRADHSAAAQDAFRTAGPVGAGSVIPDDWDDLLAPIPPEPRRVAPAAPVPQAGAVPRPQVPDDPFDALLGPAPDLPPSDPLDDLLGPGSGAPSAPQPAAVPDPLPPVAPQIAQPASVAAVPPVAEPIPTVAAARPPGTASSGGDAARAFIDALGVEGLTVPDAALPETMARLGAVMRAMIEGLREILMTRTSIKGEFRINQTMISAGRNNPLKFSITPEQAIETMVKPAARGYLDAPTATAEALRDIKAHEVAMVTGMEAALKGVLKKLDPKALEGRITDRGGLSGLLKNRKAQYWETYETLYAEISDQAENDFAELFAREFARAYQEQLERLK